MGKAAAVSERLLLTKCRLLVDRAPCADCVRRYQSAMLKMRGTRGLVGFVRLR